jgi:hypothetical protein
MPPACAIQQPIKSSTIPPARICNANTNPGISKKIETFFFRYRNKIAWVHTGMFVFFLSVLFLPLFLSEPTEADTALTHFTLTANYLMWGLWFPLVFLSVIFTGRSWCGLLCPMGAASEWANKRGLQRAIPAWVRWEGTPIVSFLIITVLGQTVGVRDHPEAIAEVFGGVLLAAIILGFVYGRKKRAWCRHMCPIGLLLGVFSRLGAVQFSPKRKKSAVEGYTEKGVCPTMIQLSHKSESRHCITCFRCTNPSSPGGLDLKIHMPGKEVEQIRTHNPNIAEIWFLFLAVGVSLGGFLWLVLPEYQTWRQDIGEWLIFEHEWYWLGNSGPSWLMSVHPERREVFNWLDFFMISGFMTACMIFMTTILSITTSLAARLSGLFGGDMNQRKRFIELGYQYAPVAMVSLVIGLGAELFSPLANIGFSNTEISMVKMLLFITGLCWSLYLGYRIVEKQGVIAKYRPLVLLPGLTGSLLTGAGWWLAIF